MCWLNSVNCLRYDLVWFVREILESSCCGCKDILWPINQRLASQWEGIWHNFPVGLRRYNPSISTVGCGFGFSVTDGLCLCHLD